MLVVLCEHLTLKLPFHHLTSSHIHGNESRIWKLQAVPYHSCLLTAMGISAEDVGVIILLSGDGIAQLR